MKTTAKAAILQRLGQSQAPLAVHELAIAGYSENALATRLSELHADGLVVRRTRDGEAFKEWRLATPEERTTLLRQPAAKRSKGLRTKVVGLQPLIGSDHELALVEVPKGRFLPQQEVSIS